MKSCLGHEGTPARNARQESHHYRRGMSVRSRLEGLRDDDDANPENNGHSGVDWNRPGNPPKRSGETDGTHESAVEDRVAGARSHRLPAGVADIERRRKT